MLPEKIEKALAQRIQQQNRTTNMYFRLLLVTSYILTLFSCQRSIEKEEPILLGRKGRVDIYMAQEADSILFLARTTGRNAFQSTSPETRRYLKYAEVPVLKDLVVAVLSDALGELMPASSSYLSGFAERAKSQLVLDLKNPVFQRRAFGRMFEPNGHAKARYYEIYKYRYDQFKNDVFSLLESEAARPFKAIAKNALNDFLIFDLPSMSYYEWLGWVLGQEGRDGFVGFHTIDTNSWDDQVLFRDAVKTNEVIIIPVRESFKRVESQLPARVPCDSPVRLTRQIDFAYRESRSYRLPRIPLLKRRAAESFAEGVSHALQPGRKHMTERAISLIEEHLLLSATVVVEQEDFFYQTYDYDIEQFRLDIPFLLIRSRAKSSARAEEILQRLYHYDGAKWEYHVCCEHGRYYSFPFCYPGDPLCMVRNLELGRELHEGIPPHGKHAQ